MSRYNPVQMIIYGLFFLVVGVIVALGQHEWKLGDTWQWMVIGGLILFVVGLRYFRRSRATGGET